MALTRGRVAMPDQARRGEIIQIKTLIRHAMETGYRVDSVGKRIPRDIVASLKVTYAGTEIFAMDFTQGVAANPYVAFHTRVVETGELVFTWTDSDGAVETVRKALTVTG
jgi:sulfur-oxidizing protein SoxZ